MRGNFRVLFRKFCLDGTILGLKYFYLYPGKVSRCYWFVFMVLSLYFACILTMLLYLRFVAMPTRIGVENQFEPIPNLPYPGITICSPNQVTRSAVQHFDKTFVDGNRTLDLQTALAHLIGFYHASRIYHDSLLQPLQDLIDVNRYSITEVMMSLPQRCDSFLKMCYFRRRRYPNCEGLFQPILTQQGLCCIFNNVYHYARSGSFVRNEKHDDFKPEKVGLWGLAQGLSVVVDFDPEDAVDSSLIFSGASQVMFTDWTEFPVDDESVLVPPSSDAYMLIRATYTYCSTDVQDLAMSIRNCRTEDEHPLPFFQKYHNSDCDLMCLVSAVEKQCHCLPFYVPRVMLLRACNVTTMPCVMDVLSNMKNMELSDTCGCPRDCEGRHYSVDLSLGNLAGLDHMVKNPYSEVNFTSTTTIMHFYFPNGVYVKQKQETVMSVTTLCSNLGGVFGLCVGCSLISVLEILFYFRAWMINVVKDRYHRSWHRKVGFHH